MKQVSTHTYSFTDYVPLFLFLCLSGNPLFTNEVYVKPLLIGITFLFIVFSIRYISSKTLQRAMVHLFKVILFIFFICILQYYSLGSVSYPGVFVIILKIILGMFILLYYRARYVNFFDLYIRMLVFLAIVSFPLFALNFFTFKGIPLDISNVKSLFFYSSFDAPAHELRNSGMFWEPGAFAGYLILALLFIAVQNKKFSIGPYKKQVFWIVAGLLTTMSTAGFILLGLITSIYIILNYPYGSIILIPVVIAIGIYSYYNLDFLSTKIEEQYSGAVEMDNSDISNTRFGSLTMDLEYIRDKPIFGNGLDKKTRYRLHPWADEDVTNGSGNGMSNFMASWGIPFFLFWLFCVYRFVMLSTRSVATAILFIILIAIMLQGEQFLNFPLFLMFFLAPIIPIFRYEDVISTDDPVV